MKYGASIIVRGPDATPATFDALAEKAEAIGLDALWASDHLVMPKQTVSRYPARAFEEANVGPKPVQSPHPPLYIGGESDAAFARVAEFGDVWHPLKPTSERIEALKPRLAAALERAGRPSEDFPIAPKVSLRFQDGPAGAGQAPTEGRPQDIVDALERFRDAGATEFCFDFMPETKETALDTLERFAQEVRPKLD